jgi:uncharacterized membrane protein (UPF0127 family)
MKRPAMMRELAVVAIAAVAVAACSSDPDPTIDARGDAVPVVSEVGAPDPSTPDPSTHGPTSDPTSGEGQQPEGFTTIRALITEPDGDVCEVCLWLADDAAERGRGLMGVTDLGDAVGMAFRFDEPTAGSFYMFQTPTPLSIAWFSPDGSHVGSADMDPCLDTPAGECPLYSPGAEYDLAIEVFRGGLGSLGLVEGSNVELIEGSEASLCPSAS